MPQPPRPELRVNRNWLEAGSVRLYVERFPGTTAHINPPCGTVPLLFNQLEFGSPTPPAQMRDFWTYAKDCCTRSVPIRSITDQCRYPFVRCPHRPRG